MTTRVDIKQNSECCATSAKASCSSATSQLPDSQSLSKCIGEEEEERDRDREKQRAEETEAEAGTEGESLLTHLFDLA